jgi:hypothetical protein
VWGAEIIDKTMNHDGAFGDLSAQDPPRLSATYNE